MEGCRMAGKWEKLHPLLKSVLLSIFVGIVGMAVIELASGQGFEAHLTKLLIGTFAGLFFIFRGY